jgi:predicted dehydrogenase
VKRYKRAKDIKVGVVGYSGAYNMGRRHFQEMQGAGMTPTAVCEVLPERLAAAEEDFPGIETYGSVEEMLKRSDVDLVSFITPHNTHAPLALKALRAGRHAVLEKPMAVSTAECDRMLSVARKNRVLVTTYHNRHWDGNILNALRRLRSGVIGEVVRVEARAGGYAKPRDWWRSSRTVSGGTLYDWGVHILEYSLQIIDAPMTEICGFAKTGFWAPKTKWKADTNEDEAFFTVRFKTGQWLTLRVTSIDSNPKPGVVEITGTKGSMTFDHRTWEIVTHEGESVVRTSGANPKSEGWRFYKNVADHLVRGRKLVITPEWGRRMIHVLDTAARSARAGRALKPKYR